MAQALLMQNAIKESLDEIQYFDELQCGACRSLKNSRYYKKNSKVFYRYLFIELLAFYCSLSYAQNITLEVGQKEPEVSSMIFPFVFHTESLDTAYGN